MKKSIILLLLAITTLYSCKEEHNNLPDGLYAEIETNKGNIILALDYQKSPITVANFITLAEGKNKFVTNNDFKNKPFYDGLKFHRVIADFMIQGGDPLGTGSGDTGYKFKDEITDLKFDTAGVLAMANNGPATNSSQFFITHLETPWLEGKHTIFGHVVEKGMEVVNKINQDDLILKITIIRNGEAAKKFDAVKTFSDYYQNESENMKKVEAEAAIEELKYKAVHDEKVITFVKLKAKATKTTTGLQYVITKKNNGKKPVNGANVYIHYSGFLENGVLFDSSMESISKIFGKYDPNRATQGGYQPIPFQYGKKDGLIPGFIEGLEKLSFGDKATLFIPTHLAYGAAGAGDVIPPNANVIFEIELLEKQSN
jgi:cyclophilin family peptidyl-prolyl cis-trans isomerase